MIFASSMRSTIHLDKKNERVLKPRELRNHNLDVSTKERVKG